MASLGWRSGGNTPDAGLSEMTLVLDVNPYVRYPLVSFNILFWLLGLGFIFTGVYAYFDAWTNPPASGRFKLDYNIYRHAKSFASSAPLFGTAKCIFIKAKLATVARRAGGETAEIPPRRPHLVGASAWPVPFSAISSLGEPTNMPVLGCGFVNIQMGVQESVPWPATKHLHREQTGRLRTRRMSTRYVRHPIHDDAPSPFASICAS
ncbi:unnamed protein product [Ixodes pacificus]